MTTLQIAPDLYLPAQAVTRRMAILAMSGAGKSNAAVVLAEAMFDAGIPWVTIDPKGDWWGVRSSKDGKRSGLPIPIFGGLHGDLQLDPTPEAGKELADTVVDLRLSCVLDVSEFESRQSMWAFLAAFGETLLRKNRHPLHLFLEEADEYLPQSTKEKGNLPKCLGVWQRVVKRGRFRGLGSTQISQRSAALNKDTLYMAEALIAMRATGKGDRNAIKGWVEHNNAALDIVASLPELADGEGWFSSPAWLRETRRVKFLLRRTFDSGATPDLLDKATRPATLADIDISALQSKMAAAIQKAKAEDPAELKRQLAALKQENDKLKRTPPTITIVENKDAQKRIAQLEAEFAKPVPIPDEVVESTHAHARHQFAYELARHLAVPEIRQAAERILSSANSAMTILSAEVDKPAPPNPLTTLPLRRSLPIPPVSAPPQPRPVIQRLPLDGPPGQPNAPLAPSAPASDSVSQKILNALAELNALGVYEPPRIQVALLAGYQHLRSKGFANAISSLSSGGYISYPNSETVALTAAGRALAKSPDKPLSSEELRQRVLTFLKPAQARILQPILRAYPAAVLRQTLAEETGYTHVRTKGFANTLSRLSSLGFVTYPNPQWVKAAPTLFPE